MKVRTSLAALLQEAVQDAASPCRLSLAEGLEPVDGDIARLRQLLASLLADASQAMLAGSPIEVTAESVVEDDDSGSLRTWVQVRVRDTGPGIAADDLPRIFEPLSSNTRPGSRSLGLAAAHTIVRAHGGSISADSTPGQGTTITFRLPAAPGTAPQAVLAAADPPATGAPSQENAPAPPRRLPRVLLIEDDDGVRSAMQRMLKRLGYAVEGVEDGRQGVAAYREAHESGAPFDIVIADLTIPGGMGGREAVGELQAIDPRVRALVASGYSDDPVLARPADFGFSGVIQKPCDMATLGRVLRETLA